MDEEIVGTEVTTQETPRTTEGTRKEVDYAELIKSDKRLQSFVDSQKTQAIKTALKNEKEKNALERTEAERLAKMTKEEKLEYQLKKKEEEYADLSKRLNARDLKYEAIKIATNPETAFDSEFLNLFKFEDMTAEELQEKAKTIKSIQDRIVEKTINEWSVILL